MIHAITKAPPPQSREKRLLGVLVRQWPGVVAEHVFAPPRRWRFDFAWPSIRVAVEYEGIFSPKSRHLGKGTGGYVADCEKYSTAAIRGWCVIRVTAPMLRDGRAADLLRAAHEARSS